MLFICCSDTCLYKILLNFIYLLNNILHIIAILFLGKIRNHFKNKGLSNDLQMYQSALYVSENNSCRALVTSSFDESRKNWRNPEALWTVYQECVLGFPFLTWQNCRTFLIDLFFIDHVQIADLFVLSNFLITWTGCYKHVTLLKVILMLT